MVVDDDVSPSGFTVAEVARRLRVSPDKVRLWIRRGELKAINTATALCGRPRWVVTAESLAEFENMRAGGPPPKPQRRRRQLDLVDYYSD
jgi:excisionase family DNA binding protein